MHPLALTYDEDMAGLIRREDIDQVRERARIDEIVGNT